MITEKSNVGFAETAGCSDDEVGRLILHNLQESLILVNPQLEVVFCNSTAKNNIRKFLGAAIYPGQCILQLAPEEQKVYLNEIFSRVLQGQLHVTENKFSLPAGGTAFFENNFRPAFDHSGAIVGIIISSREITEVKKVQQAIRESEERLQFALEAAAHGAWDWNLQTNEVVYSSSYNKLYGFEDGDLKNDVSEWINRIHPEDQQKMQASVTEHLHAENPEYDSIYRIRDNNNSYRWVMAKGRLIAFDEAGNPLRMIGTHTDITEAVEREEALKQINQRFDCMLKATHELLWEWDIPNKKMFRAKDGMKKVYGIYEDSPVTAIENWLQRVHPDDQPRLGQTLKTILTASHHQTFELEYRFRRHDGSFADIYDRCILLRNEKDEPVRVIGAAQDVSVRKRLEKDLLKAELDYQRLIHQATVDSQEKERAEIGKELHDNVNQVLTTTKLYLDLATTDTNLREELIRKSLLNINSVIQEIRHLSRSLMDPSIGDLGLIESINDLVENIHLTQKLQIRFSTDEVIESLLDTNQKLTVFRIIQEALNNVLRHAKASAVEVKICADENRLLLTIKDDGVGFHFENIKKGAGLKNIQNRIYLIQGTLHLQSEPGEGCTLQLQFPIKTNI